jgi:hypothetical protein
MVLDVSVALEPGYLVGGSVSGITTEPVQLRLNGGTPISVSADGAFQFSTLLGSGAAYAVEVVQAPVDRTLALDASNGTVASSGVNAVSVGVRSWQHPTGITGQVGIAIGDVTGVRIAANDSGDLVMAMTAYVPGSGTNLYASERTDGVWTQPSSANDAIRLETFFPNEFEVAMNSGGDTVVDWIQQVTGGVPAVFASVRRNGTWTQPTLVTDALSPNVSTASILRVGIADDGEVLVMWRQADGFRNRPYLASNANGGWQRPASTAAYFGPNIQIVSLELAVGRNGDVCAVYDGQYLFGLGFSSYVYVSERRAGNWIHPTNVLADALSPTQLQTTDVTPVIEADGSCHVFFVLQDGTSEVAAVASATAAGVWTRPASIGDGVTPANGHVAVLRAAVTPAGHLVLAVLDDVADAHYVCERVGGEWRPGTTTMTMAGRETYDAAYPAVDSQGRVFAARVEEETNPTTAISQRLFLSEYR